MPDVEKVGILPRLRSQILVGRFHLRTEMCSGMPRPARVVENRPRKRDQVGIASTDNGFGLLKLGDQADGDHWHARCLLHRARQRHLIARPDRDLLDRCETAARYVHGGATARLQRPRKGDCLVDVPVSAQSVPDTRIETARSAGKAVRTASKTSSGNRIRFSGLPPYFGWRAAR